VIEEGMRVVYAGKLHGEVVAVIPEAGRARVQFDNGTLDWFRTDLLEPEDGERQEGPPGVWLDRAGYPWLEAREPGSGLVFCYDATARAKMGDKWRVQPLEEADREFGPLTAVEAGGAWALEEDTVLFLYGGGLSVPVDAGWAQERWDWSGKRFAETVPGHAVALLDAGTFEVRPGETEAGAFVVIRRIG